MKEKKRQLDEVYFDNGKLYGGTTTTITLKSLLFLRSILLLYLS
jgi:hypothetical protein